MIIPGVVTEASGVAQGKPISTCDVGVLFSGQSPNQFFVLDRVAVAAVDPCEKEIDGHAIISITTQPGFVHQRRVCK